MLYQFVLLKPYEDLYTSLTSSIVSQQLSVKAASTIFGRVQDLCSDGDNLSATRLLNIPIDQLRACGLSQAKTRYCIAIAEAVETGQLNFSALIRLDDEAIIAELIKIPGIGRWTAEMFLIFALGATDVLATADLGLKRGMQRYLAIDDYPSDEDFVASAEVWRPYRSVASWYLWLLAD